jgi:putative nucleotidyltransferase with HDIG domain
LVYSIGAAVDQVGVDDLYHGRRVGMMSVELAEHLQMEEPVRQILYDAGLLHDCGVSSTKTHKTLLSEFEWDGAQAHCDRGCQLLAGFGPLAHLAPIIRHHHRRWSDLVQMDVASDTALAANLIYLADRIDTLAAPYYGDHSLLTHTTEICATIAKYSGSVFAPQLVDCFLGTGDKEAFWLGLAPEYVIQYQDDMAALGMPVQLTWEQFKGCANIFADIIDAKSPYTEEHSLGVSRLSGYLARLLDLPPLQYEMIEVAGLLHDLGKLQIPDEILDSADALDEIEFGIMKSHSYATYQALKRLGCMEEIAAWAGYHHECIDGSGYPFHKKDDELPIQARIINVADIFQALAQNRPYRSSMTADAILAILTDRVRKGLADEQVVRVVADHLGACMVTATTGPISP